MHLILVNVNTQHLVNCRKKWLLITKMLICLNFPMSEMMPGAFQTKWPLLSIAVLFLFFSGVVFNCYIFV